MKKACILFFRIWCVIVFLLSSPDLVNAQVRMEATGYDHKDNPTGYTFYGTATLPNKDRVPYSRIKGSPFWKDAWQLATLYSGTLKLATVPVRLNLATNEIHFLKDEKETVLEAANISAILFHPGTDVSRTEERFIMNNPYIFLNNKKVEGFVQVLNTGNYRLLKYLHRKVDAADSLFGTQKRYFFTDHAYYYMWFNDKIERIKKLNRDNILQFIRSASAYNKWINENKIDLTKEADVILFLSYYNSKQAGKDSR